MAANEELIQKIHTFFQAVADHDFSVILFREDGLCSNLDLFLKIPEHKLLAAFVRQGFQEWEHYSGEIKYPVPHPKVTSEYAYHTLGNLYALETKYGQARIALAAHMAKWVLENKEKLNDG